LKRIAIRGRKVVGHETEKTKRKGSDRDFQKKKMTRKKEALTGQEKQS